MQTKTIEFWGMTIPSTTKSILGIDTKITLRGSWFTQDGCYSTVLLEITDNLDFNFKICDSEMVNGIPEFKPLQNLAFMTEEEYFQYCTCHPFTADPDMIKAIQVKQYELITNDFQQLSKVKIDVQY